MSVEAQTVEYVYLGDGVTTVFPFPSKFISSSDILVGLDGQEQTSGFSVSGAGVATGGSVALAQAPAAGVRVSLLRKPPASQLIDFVNGQTVLEGILDTGLDKLTMICQYLLRGMKKSIRVPELDPASLSALPLPAVRANKYLAFTGDGDVTVAAGSVNAPQFTGDSGLGGATGLVPAPAAGDAAAGRFLGANGAWSVPEGNYANYANYANVKSFGAKGDGIADDTAAIQAAFASGASALYFPKGVYNYSTLTFDNAIGLRLIGDGAIGATILRCTSSGTSAGIKLRSTFDCSAEYITFDHAAGFSGYLVDPRHAPSSSTDTQGLVFSRCTFTSQGYNLHSANGIILDKTSGSIFFGCKFVGLTRPVDGQNPLGGSYATVARFIACQFADNIGFAFNYIHQGWEIIGCNFQPCHDGAQRIVYQDPTLTPFASVRFVNCTVYDCILGGTSFFTLGTGEAFTIDGGIYGGISGSNLIAAAGAIKGLTVRGAWLSLFSYIAVASVSGQEAWNLSGNRLIGSPTLVLTPSNVSGLLTDGNTPPTPRGVQAATGYRYNSDGTIEMWGTTAAVPAGSVQTINFPISFPASCWSVTANLLNPASTANNLSISSIGAASFAVYVNGSGSGGVLWRAIGK